MYRTRLFELNDHYYLWMFMCDHCHFSYNFDAIYGFYSQRYFFFSVVRRQYDMSYQGLPITFHYYQAHWYLLFAINFIQCKHKHVIQHNSKGSPSSKHVIQLHIDTRHILWSVIIIFFSFFFLKLRANAMVRGKKKEEEGEEKKNKPNQQLLHRHFVHMKTVKTNGRQLDISQHLR